MDFPVKETTSGDKKMSVNNTEIILEPRKQRERPQNSASTSSMLLTLKEPAISSSSFLLTPQEGDSTFEPTIDMMVNDFDDEQTLNEEEALAASEQQNPQDEISTLKEEGEMPLEELLAKYQALPCTTSYYRKKSKKKTKNHSNSNKKFNKCEDSVDEAKEVEKSHESATNDEEILEDCTDDTSTEKDSIETPEESLIDLEKERVVNLKRSYLLDLYPDENFNSSSVETKETCSLEDGEPQSESEDEADTDPDYVKKTIMVGTAYQAVIPAGLSQYGDVLPYENEDKLIWEPCQVSEEEVEKYLIMAREINTKLCEDETNADMRDKENDEDSSRTIGIVVMRNSINGNCDNSAKSAEQDSGGVVKDNEQALHLLVQCGYDFKEALRRKRLNAVPLTGSMSIWSEEECKNFEEGIQKYGKDFLRIRQTQVRTRSMREIVLFYYLWKKSERRDHEFANADTVDHMDIYLNESGGYGGSSTPGNLYAGGLSAQSILQQSGRNNSNSMCANNIQKNISIMTISQSSHTGTNSLKIGNNRKRNAIGSNAVTTFTTPSIISVENKQNDGDFQ